VHSRITDYDTIGNDAAILETAESYPYVISSIYAQYFQAREWIFFNPRFEPPIPGVRLTGDLFEPGTVLSISSDRNLKILNAPLRLLQTVWIYDAQTRTLFTSDSFGHSFIDHIDDSTIIDPDCDNISESEVRAQILARFPDYSRDRRDF
jgi:hypothetical protein